MMVHAVADTWVRVNWEHILGDKLTLVVRVVVSKSKETLIKAFPAPDLSCEAANSHANP